MKQKQPTFLFRVLSRFTALALLLTIALGLLLGTLAYWNEAVIRVEAEVVTATVTVGEWQLPLQSQELTSLLTQELTPLQSQEVPPLLTLEVPPTTLEITESSDDGDHITESDDQ